MSMDIVGTVSKIYEIVGPTLLRQCGYIVSCNSHANDLKREIKNLKDASTRVRHKVDHADSIGDVVEDDVWTWLTEAEELINSKSLILEKNVVSCCFGFVPNPKARYVLGRGANKCLPELRALIEKGKFDQVSYRPAAELATEVKLRSVTSSSSVGYVDLKSRALVVKRIMADLNDHDKVGVYGMGGVGKTTLLRDVEKRARESGKFDDVVTVFVSQAPNIDGIKSKILNKLRSLGSKVSSSDEANKKTLLILLDDLWSKLKELQELLAKEMDCYPTISLGVLEDEEVWRFFGELVKNNKVEEMKNNPAIVALLKKCAGLPVSIEALANVLEKKGLSSSSDLVMEDVLKLGKESIDGSASLELSYKYLGDTQVANLARSLFRIVGLLGNSSVPVLTLIKYTIGLGLLGGISSSDGNMMERARRQVSSSLRMLQDASLLLESDDRDYVKIHDVVRDVAASIASREDGALIFDREDGLKGWSNKKLKSNEERECPQLNIFIVEGGAAQGLGLPGTNSSNNNIMERARRQVTSSLRILQDASLLLESNDRDYVKIHGVTRDSIASSDDYQKSTAVYLPYSAISKLNEGWDCPELSIFIMEGDQDLSHQKEERGQVELPSCFYKGMAKLKVLDLRNAWLSSLPSSIQSDLLNLTTLFLHFCCIENVSVIGNLKSLQILSFVGSDLAHLPKEIGDLAKLRMLDLSKCSKLKTIEPGTLKMLKCLEEVFIKESFDGWEVEGAEQPTNSSLSELNHLPRLRTLEVCIPDTNTLPPSLPLGNLVRYKVLIGDSWDWSGEYRESRTLKFKENSKNILTQDWLQSALQTTQDLYLDGLSGPAGGSFHEQCKERFKELKHLHLQNSSSIQYVIWSTEWLDCRAFTVLESMILKNMDNLEKICHGLINPTSFSKLKVLRVQECHKLRNLFNLSLVSSLTELEEIEVSDCQEVREIVIAEETLEDHKEGMARASYVIKLGNLRCLKLRSLPKLTTFFGNEALSESMEITDHVLLNDQKGALQHCKPKKLWPAFKYKEIPPNTHLELDKLQRLELAYCDDITHFLSSSMLLKLVNLESLTIENCESLENIFDLNGFDAKSRNVEILPRLFELKLRGLPKLVHIWKKNDMQINGCCSLKTIEISQCNSLLYLSSSSMCEGMENLTEISVGHCNKMEAVFLEKRPTKNASSVTTGLKALKTLAISKCPNLKAFIDLNVKGMPCWCCGKQASNDLASFFSHKVFLPDLESLIISRGGEFEKLWCCEVPAKSYCKLEIIHIDHCKNLLTVFPATLIERLQKLKQLMVNDCGKLETVINLAVDWETSKKKPKSLMLPQLQKLKLKSLDSQRCIVDTNSDDEIVVGFPNLKRVEVWECKELTHLIPAATATTLLKLEEFEIKECKKLKEIVYGKVSERNKRNDVITFPHLTSLDLSHLEKLTCFYSKDDKDRSNTAATQAFFNDKVGLPNLEKFSIGFSKAVEELWGDEPPPPMGSFCKLKELSISKCEGLGNIIPSFLVERLQGLESMDITAEIFGSSVEDIFKITSTETRIIVIALTKLTILELSNNVNLGNLLSGRYILELPSLKKLTLLSTTTAILEKAHLPNLEELQVHWMKETTELWQSEPHIGSFNKLKILEVGWCGKLVKVIPLFMCKRLQNLEKLVVERCCNLQTVADSELQCHNFCNLTSMSVKNCEVVENLFTFLLGPHNHDDDDDSTNNRRTVIPHLNELRLEELPNFSHLFYVQLLHGQEGQYTLELPSLKDFFLINSGDMETVTQKVAFPKEVEIREVTENFSNFFGSSSSVVSDIVKALQQKNQVIIGLLGVMGPLMEKEVVRQVLVNEEATNLFDKVVKFSWETAADAIQAQLGEELSVVYGGETEVEGRAARVRKTLLTYIRHKRLLLIFPTVLLVKDIKMLEAAGIPRDGLDPKHFKIILVSNKEDILLKMGAQQPIIPIGNSIEYRWNIFRRELGSRFYEILREAFLQQQQQEEELVPALSDTTTDHDIIYSFVGARTIVLNNIMKALRSNQHNNLIIGILRPTINYQDQFLESTVRCLCEQENVFDEIIAPDNNQVDTIQKNLETALGIITKTTTAAHEKAQRIRQTLLSQHKRRLLLVLDDVDREIDLEAVGIPPILDPKFFKILIHSEKIKVLQKMGAQKVVFVFKRRDCESSTGADYYFCRIVDGYVGESDLKKLADECGSEYLANLLAEKLKGQGMHAWANAFRRLKESPFKYEDRKQVITSL